MSHQSYNLISTYAFRTPAHTFTTASLSSSVSNITKAPQTSRSWSFMSSNGSVAHDISLLRGPGAAWFSKSASRDRIFCFSFSRRLF